MACTFWAAASPLLTAYCPLIVYLSKSRRRWFCGGFWVRLWRRTQFSMLHCRGNYCRIADCVSVRAVQEKCDEKGLGAASGHRNVKCRRFGRAPFGYPPRLRSGLRQNRAGFLEKREKGRTLGPSSISLRMHFPVSNCPGLGLRPVVLTCGLPLLPTANRSMTR